MTLRNAFADMGTEGMLRRLLTAVTMPRDSAQRQRVVVESVPTTSVASYPRNDSTSGWNGTYAALFGASAVFAVDEREQMRLQMEQNKNYVRNQRWSFS